jgi:hypothetical protein
LARDLRPVIELAAIDAAEPAAALVARLTALPNSPPQMPVERRGR